MVQGAATLMTHLDEPPPVGRAVDRPLRIGLVASPRLTAAELTLAFCQPHPGPGKGLRSSTRRRPSQIKLIRRRLWKSGASINALPDDALIKNPVYPKETAA